MLKVKSSEKFKSRPKCQFLAVLRAWGSGVRKSFDFYCKCTSIRESTSFKLFYVKIGCRVWPPVGSGKK